MEPDPLWRTLRVTRQFLDEKATWLSEQRELDDRAAFFFIEAGKLVSFSWYHYPFASLALFQSIIGLEKSMRLLNREPKLSFQKLFAEVVEQGLIPDAVLSKLTLSKELKTKVKAKPNSQLELLSKLIPKLRNDFFHGTYLMSPDFLPLCFQMRELADALCPEIQRRKSRGLR
jgi:hypothetical protein